MKNRRDTFRLCISKFMRVCIFSFFSATLIAQVNADSLLKVWNNKSLQDTVRLNAIQKLAWDGYLFSMPDSAYYFAQLEYDFAAIKQNKKYMAQAIGTQAATFYLQSEFDKSIAYYQKALQIQILIKDAYGMSKSLNGIGVNYNARSINDSALKYYNLSHQISIKSANTTLAAIAIGNIGNLYKEEGHYNQALEYYRQSLVLSEESGDKRQKGITLKNIGNVLKEQGNYIDAIKYFMQSLEISKIIKDKRHEAIILNSIAALYLEQKEGQKALDFFNQSLKINYEIGDKLQASNVLSNIGAIYLQNNDFSNAEANFLKSLKTSREIGDKYQEALELSNIGDLHHRKNDLVKSAKYYEESLKLNQSNHNTREEANTLINLGELYLESGNQTKSIEFLKKALSLASDIGVIDGMKNAAGNLYKIYKKQGLHKEALAMSDLYYQLKDSIYNEETRRESIKTQFQIEYNNKEVELKTMAKAEMEKMELKANEESKRKNLIIYAFIGGLVLVSVFSAFIYKSLQQKKHANVLILQQKALVEEKQKEIVDSINYAKKIQFALLAHNDFLKTHLPNHFVYFNPKDIVSGDFYWATHRNENFYLAVCDSTGHGVPGAFMSLLNISFLNEAINERNISEPSEIFNYVRKKLIRNIGKDDQKDGFDGVLICINQDKKQITYAAANIAPLVISSNSIKELEYDRMPVGFGIKEEMFRNFTLALNTNETLYLFTDGFADQFGGEKGKKFKYKQLKELIASNYEKLLPQEQTLIADAFEAWKGQLEQVDDVCVIGLKL